MGLSQLTPEILQQAIATLTPEQLKALGLRRPATDQEAAAYDQAHATPGAPADFGGPVFSNPEGIKVSDDTEAGGEPTRLPEGVTLQKQIFTGRTPGDTSNPAAAQILPGSMQTIGAKFDASKPEDKPKFDPAQEYTKEGASFDPNASYEAAQATPAEAGKKESDVPEDYLTHAEDRIDEVAKTAAREVGALWDTITGIPGAVYHAAADPPTPEELKSLGLGKSTGPGRVANFIQRMIGGGQISEAARFYKQYYNATPDQRRDMETEMLSVAPEAIGTGAGAVLVPKIVEKIPGLPKAAAESKPALTAPVRLGARAAETAINQKLLPVKKLVKLMTPADEAEAFQVKVPGRDYGLAKPKPVYPGADLPADPGVFPGAEFPEAPAPEVLQARSLETPGAAPPEEASAALGRIPSPKPAPAAPAAAAAAAEAPAEILNKKGTPAELEQRLNQALGGKPLERGVSLRNQGKVATGSTPAASLPEGFTPVESTAVRGYKYNPAAKEFETITKDGRHYIHGEVSTDAAAAFAEAESKGKAWQDIRNNNPLVAKVLNGKRVGVRTAGMDAPETGEPIRKADAGMQTPLEQKVQNLSDFIRMKPDEALATPTTKLTKAKTAPKKPAASADMTAALEQSLDQVKANKGGVFTSATPADLLERWGVDPESFVEGRSQTRGMSAQDSEAAIDKLAKAYKKGQAIEPVMETRDAQNNIVEVDGRSRALAAHRAGIERIPIIVRRIQ